MKEKIKFLNDNNVILKIIETNNKHMYIKIEDGEKVIIRHPKRTPWKSIDRFLNDNKDKILKKIKEQIRNKKICFKKKFVYILGKKLKIIDLKNKEKSCCEFYNDKILFFAKNNEDKEKVFKKFAKKYLENIILKKQLLWEKKIGVLNHTIKISNKKTAWASNNIKKRQIIYSTMLIHESIDFIEYVVVHELCHSIHPNHSKDF